MQLPGLESEPTPPPPEPKIFTLTGDTGMGPCLIQCHVVGWSWDGGVWWMTGDDESVTGYSMARYNWLSLTPGEPV